MFTHNSTIDPAQLPAWLSAAILLVLLPFSAGLAGAVFLRMIIRWAAFLVKVGSIICLVLAVLGFVDLQAASGYTAQLWMAIVGIHRVFGQRVIELLMANPVSAASLATGLCVGFVFAGRRFRSAKPVPVE